MTPMQRAIAEQKICADYLLEHGHHAGAALGLADWTAEEVFLILEERCIDHSISVGTVGSSKSSQS